MITSFQLNRLLKYHLFLLLSLIGAIPVSAQLSSPTTPARGETALPTSRPVAGPMLNIKDFGAKGDGKSDDTQALKAAMQAATIGEGTIYFPTGIYPIHPVAVPSHITLLGHSAWAYENKDGRDEEYEGRTKLVALSGDARALLDLGDSRGTRILGLTLDGQRLGDGMHGIYARHAGCEQYLCIEDCRINHFSGSGVRLERSWVFSVRRSLIMFNGEHGIDLTGGYDGWVIDCQLTANKGAGLFARGSAPDDMSAEEKASLKFFGTASVMVTANRIEWNKNGGVLLAGSNSMQITGCAIDHNFGPGISLEKSIGNTISGCMVRSNGAERQGDACSQIVLKDCKGTSVTGNTLWGWYNRKEGKFDYPYPYYGIVVQNLAGCNVSQNALYHSSSKAGVQDYGGHVSTFIGQNMYVQPKIELVEGGFRLIE
ncbi:MAG: right-handed parallel beta-helix repeat-containing protein [Bacteroidota bacterium]